MSPDTVTGPVLIERPTVEPIALVLDSPHSGTVYPADFGYVCDFEILASSEDTHVHDLFGAGPALGATLVHATFPRCYIDVNRAEDDIDPALLDGPWRGPLSPSAKSAFGMGLMANLAQPGMPIYDRKLSVAEAANRIDAYHRPYHAALGAVLDETHAHFGRVFHVDCHSMTRVGTEMGPDAGIVRPEFCVSDQLGKTADPAFTRQVAEWLSGMGYDARVNDPYLGVEIVKRYGRPAERRHSIQVEIRRDLYMDEDTRRPNAGYARIKADLTALLERIRDGIARDAWGS